MNKTFEYCEEFYDILVKGSEPRVINGISLTVWEGSLVRAFDGMGVSQGYYSTIMDTLKALGCLTVIRRGSRAAPSLVALHHPPDDAEFLLLGQKDLTLPARAARLSVSDTEGRDIVKALENLDKRLQEVERILQLTGE